MSYGYDTDRLSALDAITAAQRIAFAPMLFQAARLLRDHGILAYLDQCSPAGAGLDDVAGATPLSRYAVSLLLDVGLGGRLVVQRDDRYFLAKTGHYLLHDPMTRVNMDFMHDVCYQGMFHLDEALREGKPAGLKVFGEWPTIYPALSQLPPKAQQSWFAFDHFYSDAAFNAALPHVFALNPAHLYDVGGNTGKWAMRCYDYAPEVQVTLIDLPAQITLSRPLIAAAGKADRIHGIGVDMLSDDPLPGEADIWWMSQFLDCFSEAQIVAILRKIGAAMKPGARVCILDIFWDRQDWEAAAFTLNASSLYFTCLANGTSRFYAATRFLPLVEEAGFVVEQQIDGLGVGHTLLVCKKSAA
ncbi:SAM-dependent methyltransferase [Chimaeribacter californicus]|uniref:SAM-dependent methyltransferase n=1 Tax=Chimaeribacter californicus TaxID=2060067 RepID=A0A2N5E781_9GAMM|nr:methyltransferase [Chimaeribacter californicus]PLR37337.1 SAM-dependent methyltransferase [Chimaeribacter californicus]